MMRTWAVGTVWGWCGLGLLGSGGVVSCVVREARFRIEVCGLSGPI